MAKLIVIPRLGVTMTEGKLVRWLKEVGDGVEVGEPLFEVETDKVVMEAEALYAGVLLQKLTGGDAVLPVGGVVGVIGFSGEKYDLEELLGQK